MERSVNLSWGSGITLSKSTTPHSYHGVRRTRTTIRYKYESRSFPCSLKFSGFQPKDKSFHFHLICAPHHCDAPNLRINSNYPKTYSWKSGGKARRLPNILKKVSEKTSIRCRIKCNNRIIFSPLYSSPRSESVSFHTADNKTRRRPPSSALK